MGKRRARRENWLFLSAGERIKWGGAAHKRNTLARRVPKQEERVRKEGNTDARGESACWSRQQAVGASVWQGEAVFPSPS